VFDYETDEHNFSIRVRVTDEHNFSLEKVFVIHLLNVVEDHDGDGVEDHYDPDDDNDGFLDLDELSYGSDPLDPNSVANAAPKSLVLSNASIFENEPTGTIVGKLSGSDPDGNISLTFARAQGQGSRNNNLFYIGPHNNLRSKESFDYESNQTFSVRLQVRDEHNASLEQIFEIQVLDVDDTAPVITLLGDANITHEAGAEYIDAGAEWTDVVDGTGQARVSGEVNASKLGSYLLSYQHTDKAGNASTQKTREVQVVDTTSPQISLLGDGNLTHLVGLNFIDQGAVWTDAVDGQGHVLGSGQVNDLMVGTYFLSYSYRDSQGNNSPNIIRTIHVVDSESPVIRLSGGSRVIHEAGIKFVDPGATWFDQVDGNGAPHITGDVNSNLPGEYLLTYSFTDSSGNSAVTVFRTVIVADRTAPTLALNGETVLSIPVGSNFTDLGAGWTDAVDGAGKVMGIGQVNTSIPGDYLLIYEHTDQAGNKSKNIERLVRVFGNAPENLVSVGKLTIKENRPIGSVVGHFRANDLNESSLRFELISGGADHDRLLFSLDVNGTLKTGTVFDYESDSQRFPISVRVWNEHNKSTEKNFYVSVINTLEDMDGDGVEDVIDDDRDGDGISNDDEMDNQTDPDNPYLLSNKPILITRTTSINEDDSIDLKGRVLSDGQGQITDFGFVISSGVSMDPQKSKVYWVRGVGDPSTFKLKVTKSPFEKTMYFRAWAKNVAGYGIGAVRKVTIPEVPKPWWGEVEEREGGWKNSNWFGSFIYNERGWLYHAHLGWLYSSSAKENSVWLWREENGWLWTKEDTWPYLWSHQTGYWLYLTPSKAGQTIRFYDYSTESYR
ncbi:immunoglobulin-like domain-containing protein, partial [Candidatus Chordibacter forsetii]|uniref:immunoglobulin-like domain-containing protein n=1 Tax=Candidatus Chordibacter forsetii TaxID=3381758 RepID=UPI00389B1D79